MAACSAEVVPVSAPVLVLKVRPVGGVGLMLHEVAASPALVMVTPTTTPAELTTAVPVAVVPPAGAEAKVTVGGEACE